MFDLSLEVLRVVEDAAIASARTMGMGDPNASDQAAVESMRHSLDTLAIDGIIVIGEGERDKAPGKTLVFAASGVTDGNLLRGVRFTGDGSHTQSIVMNSTPARVRFIETTHLENRPDVKVRFR